MYDKNPDKFDTAKLINKVNIENLKDFDSDFSTQSGNNLEDLSPKFRLQREQRSQIPIH